MESTRRGVHAGCADTLAGWSENDLAPFVRLLGAVNDGIERRRRPCAPREAPGCRAVETAANR
ncbi:hypothetical protein [Herbiconiux ginsengi]|uniref:hypothetical protein n=1 Tax=Herbiconiux ginsengi TaxID=381665 RepID=UPI000B823550|nr:hypothetical protein [Herbiconiux ginsengi]